ncbi:hypothetical protein NPX13_g4224 [Xylaria arbuscula]|uniref:Uncharacterized protein n=1 Tax=Xylaria arbuscula TaxID=114810 RepID=A0A9W8TPC3_9PEZI|nr:hypothetical protein NPX13_g4224 [Xylaria arbuscula]
MMEKKPMRQLKARPNSRVPEGTIAAATAEGLPAGFLNAVESRLRETEEALFYALSELHEGNIEDRAYAGLSYPRASSQNKSKMMEKWAKLPLGDRAQAKAWFLSQRLGGDEEEEESPTNLTLAAPRSGVQQKAASSSSSTPGGIKSAPAESGRRGGDMTPPSPRLASPLLDSSMAVPASHTHPRSHGWDTLAEKPTTAAAIFDIDDISS